MHGAFAESLSNWKPVLGLLLAKGYKVVAAPNPLRGVSSDAAYVSSFLNTIDSPIVLVGHSYGGAVITNAATQSVKALVYVAAFAPDTGESVVTRAAEVTLLADESTAFLAGAINPSTASQQKRKRAVGAVFEPISRWCDKCVGSHPRRSHHAGQGWQSKGRVMHGQIDWRRDSSLTTRDMA